MLLLSAVCIVFVYVFFVFCLLKKSLMVKLSIYIHINVDRIRMYIYIYYLNTRCVMLSWAWLLAADTFSFCLIALSRVVVWHLFVNCSTCLGVVGIVSSSSSPLACAKCVCRRYCGDSDEVARFAAVRWPDPFVAVLCGPTHSSSSSVVDAVVVDGGGGVLLSTEICREAYSSGGGSGVDGGGSDRCRNNWCGIVDGVDGEERDASIDV